MKHFLRPPTTEIPQRLLVKPLADEDMFQWLVLQNQVAGSVTSGSLQQLAELEQSLPGIELVLLLPAGHISLRSLPVTEAERKLYRQMLPFALEDSLVENADELHFSYQPLADARMGVVLVRHAELQSLLEQFWAAGLAIDVITPETLLQPFSQQQQTWMVRGDEVVARTGPCAGFSATLDSVALVAGLPDTDGNEPATQLQLVVEQGVDADRAVAQICTAIPGLDGHIQVQPVADILAWQATVLPDKPFTLQQGDFRPPLRWRHYLRLWQPVALVCLAALVMNYGVLLYHYNSVKGTAGQLQAEKYALAREVIPVGKISSPERQMRAAMTQRSSTGPTRFGAMLARVGPALGGESGYTVRTINYDGNNESLRLEVRTRDFQQIEQFRTTLANSGLQAELLNSSAQGQGILARLELVEAGR
jgi:general secretion pathway protein L